MPHPPAWFPRTTFLSVKRASVTERIFLQVWWQFSQSVVSPVPSFPKEGNGDTTDYKLSSHYFTNSPYNQIFVCFFVSLSLSFVSRQKKESCNTNVTSMTSPCNLKLRPLQAEITYTHLWRQFIYALSFSSSY